MFGWKYCCIFWELKWNIIDQYHFNKGSRTSFVPPHHFTLRVNSKFLKSTGTAGSLYEGSVSVITVLKSILSRAYLWTKSKINVVKNWDYEYCLRYMFACMCVCIYLYSFCDIIIILLAVLQWHCWRDSWSHCCSLGGPWHIFISARPFNCRQSWTDTCTKVGMAVDWTCRTFVGGASIEVLVLWWNPGLNSWG
jgi:hypothetical protein